MFESVISCAELAARHGEADLVIVDCRFDLGTPAAGRAAWLAAHIPGAVYADLEECLSGPPSTDHGRHPMPPAPLIAERCGQLGIGNTSQVVAYDDTGGMIAARLWWMLRFLGHRAVAVLDGGWSHWVAAGLPVRGGAERRVPGDFVGTPALARLVRIDDIDPGTVLLDAREPARYRGEVEPIDPVAGHIPGASNHFWRDNLTEDGRFLPPVDLHARLSAALGATPNDSTTHYCGSGVSACHNSLAQFIAGAGEGRLYCGSWSEWCRDPMRRGMME
jgi:thiosulfate/3-mercaptopyruvate sulfurtransferase